jgi:hypothetical protein
MRFAASIALVLALAACERESAPSDTVKEAADTIVGQVDGSTPAPKLAVGKYAPRDECQDQPGAEDFRRTLAKAVKDRDADALAALAAPDVKLDFGGGTGIGELRTRLAKKDWSLWDELDQLMELGCAVNEQGGITMPWYFAQPIDEVDHAMGMLVTGEKVPLHKDASADSPTVTEISWDVVELKGGLQPGDKFQEVVTPDGKTAGFVATDKLRSLLDYRLIASSRDGKWSFTSLVAGD